MLVTVGAAGCSTADDETPSGTPGAEGEAAGDGPFGDLPSFDLFLVLPANATAGQVFNVTLETSFVANSTEALNVTWTVSAAAMDGNQTNGTALAIAQGAGVPATFNVTFEAVGNMTLLAHATLAGYQDANATAAIVVVEAVALPEPEVPAEPPFEPVHIERTAQFGCYHCYTTAAQPDNCIGLRAGQNDRDCIWFSIDPAWVGRDFTTGAANDSDVTFKTACSAGGNVQSFASEGHETGKIPDGAKCAVMWNWSPTTGGKITMDIF